jgi:hypothetical protein
MSGTFWSKTVARFGKARIEHRRQDLQDGLLDHAVQHVWNAELSLSAIRFVDGHPSHRCGAIGPLEKLLSDRRPTRSQPLEKHVERNAVGPGGSTVAADAVPGSLHVGSGDNGFHHHLWKQTQGWLLNRRRHGSSRTG